MMSHADPAPSRWLSLLMAGIGAVAVLVLVAMAAFVGLNMRSGGPIDPARGGLAPGQPAPPVEAAGWINGEPSDLSGKVVVLHGWFVDCPFCWQEAPHIAALCDRYSDKGVAFVGLTPDPASDIDRVRDFITKNGLPYPNGYEAQTTLGGLKAQYYPALWVVGKDGKVVWNMAMEPKQSLEEAIQEALAVKPAAT